MNESIFRNILTGSLAVVDQDITLFEDSITEYEIVKAIKDRGITRSF